MLAAIAASASSATDASRPTFLSPAPGTAAKYVSGEVIVRYVTHTDSSERADTRSDAGATLHSKLPLPQLEIVKLTDGQSVPQAVAELNRDPRVKYAEPNYLLSPRAATNDPEFGNQWGFENTGQALPYWPGGTPDADIDAPEAWAITHGSSNVIVADVDTGADYLHEDLSPNVWTNGGDGPAVDGVDNDGNGKVDDYYGWDFTSNDRDPSDSFGHGTNTAGTIAAATDNSKGGAGTGFNSKVMVLRAMSTGDAINAYSYAAHNGARIANLSFGAPGSIAEKDMIDALPNVLFVAAAADAPIDTDALSTGDYPCGYTSPNVICVAASSMTDGFTSFSAWGATSVDLAAPGENILVPKNGGGYEYVSGTSFSSPMTAGVAALLLAVHPTATSADLKFALLEGADKKPAFAGKLVSGGRLNAANSLNIMQSDGANARVSITNSTLQFEGAAGLGDSLTISLSGSTLTLVDGAPMVPGPGCASGGPDTITCSSTGVNAIRVQAAGGNDTIVNLTAIPSTIFGGDGNDSLTGGSGNDVLVGGAGSDVLDGAGGVDTADYSGRTTPVTVDLDNVADDGDPSLPGGEQDNVKTTIETLVGGAAGDTLTGSAAADTIDGGPGNNVIDGGLGNDLLFASVGSDDFHGGGGTDTVDYSTRPSTMGEGVRVSIDDAANDGIGGYGIGGYNVLEQDNVHKDVENVNGTKYNDTLTGSEFNNRLDGGRGNDILDGGIGNDVVIGGAGVDSMTYASRTTPVVVDMDDVADDGQTSIGEVDNVASDIENLTTGSGNDTLTGDALDNLLDGGAGADTIKGGAGSDTVNYSTRTTKVTTTFDGSANDGAAESDNLGTDMENVISGSGGDTLTGSTANNRLEGGDGVDTITGGNGNDVIVPGAGTDTFTGGAGTDTVSYEDHTAAVTATLGTSGNGQSGENETIPTDFENLTGGFGNDSLTGNANANTLNGQAGQDSISGGSGNDDIQGDPVWVAAQGATDANGCLNELGGNDVLHGDAGNDLITGGAGADSINGDAGDDRLRDGFNADAICRDGTSDSDPDSLNGGIGNDTVDYSGIPAGFGGVRVSIDDVANDGPWGTTDNVHMDVEKVIGSPNPDWLFGGTGADTLVSGGNAGTNGSPDILNGLEGNDRLLPGKGFVIIDGGDGTDTLDYSGAGSGITVSLNSGENQVTGDGGTHHVAGIESIVGSPFADNLTGSPGDDTFDGGAGADVFNGLSGTDTVTYSSKAAAVTADIDGVADDGNSTDGSTTKDNVMPDIENLTGSGFADTLTGNTGDNTLIGGAGADVFNGLAGTDTVSYNDSAHVAGVTADIDGVADDGNTTDGSTTKDNVKADIENLSGTNFADTLTGSTGNNALLGLLGADILSGGNGNDSLDANDDVADSSLNCGSGTDSLIADPIDPASTGCETISFP